MKFRHGFSGPMIAAAAVGIAFALATGAGAVPAHASPVPAAAVPVSNVHAGQVVGQVVRSGGKCSAKLVRPVHISVEATPAHPSASATIAVNAKCQVIVTRVAYDPVARADSAPDAAASVCTRKTEASIDANTMGAEVAQLSTFLNYRQNCTWGSIIAASASETSSVTGFGATLLFSLSNNYLHLNSVTTTSMVADAQDLLTEGIRSTGPIDLSGNIEAKNTTAASGAVNANCFWDSGLSTSLTMTCHAQRIS